MRIYELRVASLGIIPLRDTYYFTSQTKAMKVFRKHKKEQAVVDLYECKVDTNLKADDWCKLLATDAPGSDCELTPQGLIFYRNLIATCAPKAEAAKLHSKKLKQHNPPINVHEKAGSA